MRCASNSSEAEAALADLSSSLQRRLANWGKDFQEEFPTYEIVLPLIKGDSASKPGLADMAFVLRNNAFTEYAVAPNKGLLAVKIEAMQWRRLDLHIEAIDVVSQSARETPTQIIVRLPPEYAVAKAGAHTSVKGQNGKLVPQPLIVREAPGGIAECCPELGQRWGAIRQRRQDVVDTSVIYGVSLASVIYSATRRSEVYDLLIWLAEQAGRRFGSLRDVEDRLGWELASVQKPLPLYALPRSGRQWAG